MKSVLSQQNKNRNFGNEVLNFPAIGLNLNEVSSISLFSQMVLFGAFHKTVKSDC
jgi:hypothetical protein